MGSTMPKSPVSNAWGARGALQPHATTEAMYLLSAAARATPSSRATVYYPLGDSLSIKSHHRARIHRTHDHRAHLCTLSAVVCTPCLYCTCEHSNKNSFTLCAPHLGLYSFYIVPAYVQRRLEACTTPNTRTPCPR